MLLQYSQGVGPTIPQGYTCYIIRNHPVIQMSTMWKVRCLNGALWYLTHSHRDAHIKLFEIIVVLICPPAAPPVSVKEGVLAHGQWGGVRKVGTYP